jgi:hypothetical protein
VQLVCDDDFVYPAPYVEKMAAAVVRHNGAAVSLHGGTFIVSAGSYYRGRRMHPWSVALHDDVTVNVLGTGCLAYLPGRPVVRWPRDFPLRNMADVWFSLLCRKQQIPMVVIAHRGNELRYMRPTDAICENRHLYDDPATEAAIISGHW